MRKIEMSPEITVEYTAEDDALFVSFSFDSEDPEAATIYILPVPVAIWLTKAIQAEIPHVPYDSIRASIVEVKEK